MPISTTTACADWRVAIVDDHEAVRGAVSSLLRSCGYATIAFDSAESLLQVLAPGSFDCIVSDLQMPGMSGLELLEHLRRNGCRMPLIVLTAFPEPAVRERALQSGAAGFLSKPFQADELMRCVARACAGAAPSLPTHPATQ